ncbi:Acetyltransferase [Trichoplax sp. H2]|uniref:N-acetyltransferase domain-containing protein n=1 Tax=Trichoplax adhaerens TaxID=10228 RepID=B3S2G6_TRIAD|nr:hypothetical protein TRIADDRAFT_58018 [Trichoplax adhaerens]EDV23093.1 hypothetical protein TRIADDRAFT_58018 [Trichoplax adhaerens]RDD47816.1 Acetyltransferase [Trichoplax sp. H2]|eukprot:XP_002114003.1 hypothetical protein TRIADDRAFT_58018 [Trichoplax adhaerens]
MEIVNAVIPDDLEEIRSLFREYENFLEVDICFQGFEEELQTLPGKYAQPKGRLLLARKNDIIAGCVGLRELQPGICEMKRLYVRPKFQGKNLGRKLVKRIIQEAQNIGYTRMRLDSLGKLKAALSLYKSLGFRETRPYYDNPLSNVVYLQLDLTQLSNSSE